MDDQHCTEPSFLARLGTAMACGWRALTRPAFCRQAAALLQAPATPAPAPAPVKPIDRPSEPPQASGLLVLSMLQREGRLIDFLQEEVAPVTDADLGAAARVVHEGCRKVLAQCLTLEPVLKDAEGATVNVPVGFDAQRIRLTGNVTGRPPFRGALQHHGWVATSVRWPSTSATLDSRVLAPAEVELS